MKRLFLLLYAICIWAVPNVLSITIEHTCVFSSEDAVMSTKEINSQRFCSLNYTNLISFGEPGEPNLPVKNLTFFLPFNACDINIVETTTSEKKSSQNNINPQKLSSVTFLSDVRFTFDAQEDVFINSNVLVEEGASVTIFTPGICHVDNPIIKAGGKLTIYADSCAVPSSQKVYNNRIEIHPYDKYGQENGNLRRLAKSMPQGYMNLLEEGKEWKYRMICHDAKKFGFEPAAGVDEFCRTLRIEGCTEIDGINYYNLNEYITLLSGESSDDLNTTFQLPQEAPLLFLAEDCQNGVVYVKQDDSDFIGGTWRAERQSPANGVLYDFFNSTGINGDSQLGNMSVETETGSLRAYSVTGIGSNHQFKNYDNLIVVEGVGFTEGSPVSYRHGCDLLGEAVNCTTSFPDRMYYPHLYNVSLSDGSVIFSDPTYGIDLNSLDGGWENAEVMLGNGSIVVKANGNVRLYDSRGCLVNESHIDGERRIDVSAMPHGLYLLVAGGKTFKILL